MDVPFTYVSNFKTPSPAAIIASEDAVLAHEEMELNKKKRNHEKRKTKKRVH